MTKEILLGLFSLIWIPMIAGLLAGVDRVLTARMQSRVGPPILQPFYDIFKLFEKQKLVVNVFHYDFVIISFVFTAASAALFFAGENLLIDLFALIAGNVFIVLAAYSSNSPYSLMGAERELLQMLAAEPMILLAAVGFYMVTGTFSVGEIAASGQLPILYLPGVFIALTYVLTIKLRKSPFDLATSHHAHQELVKGLSTEFAGPSLALFEIGHWYETILLLGMIYLFFASKPLLGILAVAVIYFIEILVDNLAARVKWELMLASAWIVTLILGIGNLMILYFVY